MVRFGTQDPFFKPLIEQYREILDTLKEELLINDFPQISPVAIRLATELNPTPQAVVNPSFEQVSRQTHLYLLQYIRQICMLKQAVRHILPPVKCSKRLARKHYLRALFGPPPICGIEGALELSASFGCAHAKEAATETPIFTLHPRSIADEQVIESTFNDLYNSIKAEPRRKRRRFDNGRLHSIVEKMVSINEFQSMTFILAPDWEIFAVREPQKESEVSHAVNLIEAFLKAADPSNYKGDGKFDVWLRKMIETFRQEAKIETFQGAIGRRFALIYFTVVRIAEQLSRLPIHCRGKDYRESMVKVAASYGDFFKSVPSYLETGTDRNRCAVMQSAGNLLLSVHEACGNLRTLGLTEVIRRGCSIFIRSSFERARAVQKWRVQLIESEQQPRGDEEKRHRGEGVIFNTCVRLKDREGMDKKGRLWDFMRLVNADRDVWSRYIRAAANLFPPDEYDRLIGVGNSGIIPASILSLAFLRRMSACFLQPCLDLFPAPLMLEKCSLVDDSLQTGYSLCVTRLQLRNLGFPVDVRDMFVTMKNVRPPKVLGEGENVLPGIYTEGLIDRSGVRSIVDYEFSTEADGSFEPVCIRDRGHEVNTSALEKTKDTIESTLDYCRSREHGMPLDERGIKRLVNLCRSKQFFKPWLLFNHPAKLLGLSHYWYEAAAEEGVEAVIGSSSLDLPFVIGMALLDRYCFEGKMRFLVYDSSRRNLEGIDAAVESGAKRAVVIDTTIKTGETLKLVKEQAASRGVNCALVCGLYSHLSKSDVEKIIPKALIAAYMVP